MTLSKIVAIGLTTSILAACNNTINVTPQQAYEAVTAVNAIEATATNYLKLPLCPAAVVCRTQIASADIAVGGRNLYAEKNRVLTYMQSNPGQPIPITLTQALSVAVATLQVLYAKYGVTQ